MNRRNGQSFANLKMSREVHPKKTPRLMPNVRDSTQRIIHSLRCTRVLYETISASHGNLEDDINIGELIQKQLAALRTLPSVTEEARSFGAAYEQTKSGVSLGRTSKGFRRQPQETDTLALEWMLCQSMKNKSSQVLDFQFGVSKKSLKMVAAYSDGYLRGF